MKDEKMKKENKRGRKKKNQNNFISRTLLRKN